MIDPEILVNTPDVVRLSQKKRGESQSIVEDALIARRNLRTAINNFETLRAEQNVLSKKIAGSEDSDRPELMRVANLLAERVKNAREEQEKANSEWKKLLFEIPNIVSSEAPYGVEDKCAVMKTVGDIPEFDFEPADHLQLGEQLDAIDVSRGVKVSGTRFYFLKGWGARLELAVMNLALDLALKSGLTLLITPTLVKPEIMLGTGFLGRHEGEVYRLPSGYYLTGTSEVAIAGYHSDEILDISSGPIRYAGWSSCYRREAGSHGRDTRGIMRVHQFSKLEMFSYVHPQQSTRELEHIVSMQEKMLNLLEIPYRVSDIAAEELGTSASRKYDLEAWIPSQNTWREVTSASDCTTFQARRLNVRYRDESGRTGYVATLNGTLATTRFLVAILENHQTSNGSIRVPEALRPLLGQDVIER